MKLAMVESSVFDSTIFTSENTLVLAGNVKSKTVALLLRNLAKAAKLALIP